MIYHTTPRNFETNVDDNLVIGYYHGKAIIRNAFGDLCFMQCEEAHAPEGTVIASNELTPLSVLQKEEQDEIKKIYL